MAGSGEVVTFRELDEESNRLAHLFRAAGLRPGDPIAFMLENHRSFLAIAWAAQRSGLYYTAISSRLLTDELAYIVKNCEAKVVHLLRPLAGRRGRGRRRDARRGAAPHARRHRRRASPRTRSASPHSPPRRSTTSARARTCSIPPAPPGGPRASSRAPSPSRRSTRRAGADSARSPVRPDAGQRLSLAGAAVPRRPLRWSHDGPAPGRHRRGDGAVRPRGRAARSSSSTGSRTASGCRPFRPHAQAAGGGARALRRVVAASRDARRRALPGAGEGSR